MANVPAVRKNTLPANIEKQMKEDAAKGAKKVANIGVGQFMSIRGGILAFQGTPVPGNKMLAVVLADIFENAWYKEEFDADNPTPPNCYAFGDDEQSMAPHAQAEDKQSDACSGCEKNKFGTAEKGRGKACKNGMRMAVMHADSLKGDVTKDAQVAFLKIPPTSMPGWAQYVKSLENLHGRPAYGVITEISVVPDMKTQYKVCSPTSQEHLRQEAACGDLLEGEGAPATWHSRTSRSTPAPMKKKPGGKKAAGRGQPAARQPAQQARQQPRGKF
jgi:hypothetical protein